MKFTRKTLKTTRIFALAWTVLIAAFSLIVFFPAATKLAMLTACVGFLLFTTWKLAETFVDD